MENLLTRVITAGFIGSIIQFRTVEDPISISGLMYQSTVLQSYFLLQESNFTQENQLPCTLLAIQRLFKGTFTGWHVTVLMVYFCNDF